MNLKDFRLLCDENIQPAFVAFLRSEGFEVKDVKESQLHGESDRNLLLLASEEDRVVLTHDSDFGRLVFTQPLAFVGIVYLRPGHFSPDFTIGTWRALEEASLALRPPFVIVAENDGKTVKVRYRQM